MLSIYFNEYPWGGRIILSLKWVRNKMNKNGMNSSVGNYLTNASLFKNGQKNRLVSSYVTHRSYFAQEERGNPAINVPNMTKSKK